MLHYRIIAPLSDFCIPSHQQNLNNKANAGKRHLVSVTCFDDSGFDYLKYHYFKQCFLIVVVHQMPPPKIKNVRWSARLSDPADMNKINCPAANAATMARPRSGKLCEDDC